MQEVKYEKILPTFDGNDLRTSNEFSFVVTPSTDYFTRQEDFKVCLFPPNDLTIIVFVFLSFNTDYQMVLDAQVIVTVRRGAVTTRELLYPPRHQITLPLNNLNFIFDGCEVAFNQTTKLTSDK